MLGKVALRRIQLCQCRKASSVLIANRGEIAVRIARAAGELGFDAVGVYSQDDKTWQQCSQLNKMVALKGTGVAPYLDQTQLIDVATANGCSYIHPGYGFLSENADFAEACLRKNIKFVGPTSDQLRLFGDKIHARALAEECNVPVIPGTNCVTDITQAQSFFKTLPPHTHMIVKARSGGGGRGIRVVKSFDEISQIMERCSSEATRAYGDGGLYVEMLVPAARHIEVQIIGDGTTCYHVWDRECR